MVQQIKRFGWKPDFPDHRDHFYKNKVARLQPIQTVDLRQTKIMPARRDQYTLGSCTGFAIAFLLTYLFKNGFFKTASNLLMPFSPLFIYYNERAIEGTIKEDSGAYIRDGIKSVAQQGCCSDNLWPYILKNFARKPTWQCYKSGLDHQAIEYLRLDNTNKQELVNCLLEGFPIVHGFSVYADFDSYRVATTGVVNLPGSSESFLGGHATCIVGYILETDRFICANSWSEGWGQQGYYTIPAEYLCNENLADDFWTIRVIE